MTEEHNNHTPLTTEELNSLGIEVSYEGEDTTFTIDPHARLEEDELKGGGRSWDSWVDPTITETDLIESEIMFHAPALLEHLKDVEAGHLSRTQIASVRRVIKTFTSEHNIHKRGLWLFQDEPHKGRIVITKHPDFIDPHNPLYDGKYHANFTTEQEGLTTDIIATLQIHKGEWVIKIYEDEQHEQ